MHTTLTISDDKKSAVMLRSHHPRAKKRAPSEFRPRAESEYGSKAYRDACQRAFNRAKLHIFFNRDMTNFVTLTYRGTEHSPEDVMRDIKLLVKKDARRSRIRPKYIWVMEYQKRGSIHVHMICNDFFSLQVNRNGYDELINWPNGYSSILRIKDFDSNFRPYLYLFKYMRKSQRIGKTFVHSSRNLQNYRTTTEHQNLESWNTIAMERTQATINNTQFIYYKNFLIKDDTIEPQQTNPPQNESITTWLEPAK